MSGKKFNFDIFNNIYNNLDNLPNLVDFSLHLNIKEEQLENVINKYKKFCGKILSKKYIRRINIELFDGPIYSNKKLVEMFPNINFKKYYEVRIIKLPTEFYFSQKNAPNSTSNMIKDFKNVRDVKEAKDNKGLKGAKNGKNNKNSKGNRCIIY